MGETALSDKDRHFAASLVEARCPILGIRARMPCTRFRYLRGPQACQFVAHWNYLGDKLFVCPTNGGGVLNAQAFAAEIMRQKGGMVMGVLVNSAQDSPSKYGAGDMRDEATELPARGLRQGSKLKMSMEKKIENIWLESEQQGWTYSDFVSHLIEILIVLNYREFHTTLIPRRTPRRLHPDARDGLITTACCSGARCSISFSARRAFEEQELLSRLSPQPLKQVLNRMMRPGLCDEIPMLRFLSG